MALEAVDAASASETAPDAAAADADDVAAVAGGGGGAAAAGDDAEADERAVADASGRQARENW